MKRIAISFAIALGLQAIFVAGAQGLFGHGGAMSFFGAIAYLSSVLSWPIPFVDSLVQSWAFIPIVMILVPSLVYTVPIWIVMKTTDWLITKLFYGNTESGPSQSSEPTLLSRTSPADQEPRLP